MSVSIFDLFSIGIGPSSSHTVGPMRAAAAFIDEVRSTYDLRAVTRLEVELFGSLAATGAGHGTPGAILLGLEGNDPGTIDPTYARDRVAQIEQTQQVIIGSEQPIAFGTRAIVLSPGKNAGHSNALRFVAHIGSAPNQHTVHASTFHSVGGGFIERADAAPDRTGEVAQAFSYESGADLLELCRRQHLSISDVMMRIEASRSSERDVRSRLLGIWTVMADSIENGFHSSAPYLPGALMVRRRAPALYTRLASQPSDRADAMDWLTVAAMAVNEENAAGGRIVTAPTNGAAGIVPAVLYWALRFLPQLHSRRQDDVIVQYLLTAGAIAALYKTGASISGAEVGCQGEIGSACSMAAGALAALMGATPAQVENAAEIGIEHNLGLTCDPIGGLVQIPCIERNAVGAVKAVNAARIAIHGDGTHRVSLDQAIETMRQTGADMHEKYKETSLGGLAVNVPEC